MNIFNPIKIAYKALLLHKVRSLLTVLGLTIGIMSIIIVLSVGQGFENFVMGQMEIFGSGYIDIEPRVPKDSRASQVQSGLITTLTIDDAKEVGKHPNIRDYYIGVMGQNILTYQDKNKSTMLFGMSASGFDLFGPKVEFGRPFTEEEDKSLAKVVVLGKEVRENFFGDSNPIGERIKIGKHNFRIIGVMEEQGSAGIMNMNEMVFVPVRTLQKQIMGINHIQFIMAFLKDTSKAEETAAELNEIMKDQHGIEDDDKADFEVMTTEEMMKTVGSITGAVNLLLLAIATISLIVGGVGIMNIMYVSVSERTYEIGLRKAIGATKSNILWQFILEAIILTSVGGVVGVLLGTGFTQLVLFIASSMGFDFGNVFSLFSVVLGVGFSALVGLIFGIYPARKAANMQPVEALRSE